MTAKVQSNISRFQFEYQEELFMPESSVNSMSIGVPKENHKKERRVAITPFTVRFLTENGIKVMVETGVGLASGFEDLHYAEYGAVIVKTQEEVYQADIIIKVAPACENEIKLLRKNQILISSLNVKTLSKTYFQELIKKKVTAIALEFIKDENGEFPFVQMMSEISGKVAINYAANFMREQRGKLLGSIAGNRPSEVLVLGAGYMAQSAAQSAIDQGAVVKVFDPSISKLRVLSQKVSQPIYTSVFHLSVLKKELPRADVLIGAMSVKDLLNGYAIKEELIGMIKKDAIILDLNIDQVSCFETSQLTDFNQPTKIIHGVTHFGVPNVPSMVPRTASYALGNIFLQQLSSFKHYGNVTQFLKNDVNFRNGLYLYNGIMVNRQIADIFDLPNQDIDLILSAF